MWYAVDGLRHLGEPGLRTSRTRLSEELDARSLFALVIQACVVRDTHRFATCAAMAEALPHLRSAFISALDWVTPADVQVASSHTQAPTEMSRLVRLRLRTHARFDIATHPAPDAQSPEGLRLLLRAARLCNRPDWVPVRVLTHIASDTRTLRALCRHQLLFGSEAERDAVLEQHFERALEPGIDGERWSALFAAEPGTRGRRFLRALYERTGSDRRMLIALGWHGSVQSVPHLVTLLENPTHARTAAHVLTMITGAVPDRDGWLAPAPPAGLLRDPARPKPDPDRDLPWPEHRGFVNWWAQHRTSFDSEQPYLLGQPRTPHKLLTLLRHAPLNWRAAAAWMLQRHTPGCALDTTAPASMQYATLARLDPDLEPTS